MASPPLALTRRSLAGILAVLAPVAATVPAAAAPVVSPVLAEIIAAHRSANLSLTQALLPRDEDVPGSIEPWQAVTPVRPDTPHSRARRVLNASAELLACLVIIGGGAALVGLASHF